MALATEEKNKIVKKYQQSENDTGSPQVQIALLTAQINDLTEHLKSHKQDKHSRRGLISMVGKRRKMIKYLERTGDQSKMKKFLKDLGID